MGVPSGLGAQLGLVAEETFGTYKAPSKFYVFDSESITAQRNFLSSTGLKAGQMAPPVALHKQTTRSATGDVSMKVPNKGFGTLLNLLHGNTVTPTKIGSGTAYKQIHKIGENAPIGKSLTVQVGRPDVTGTVQPFSYIGSKITNLALSCPTGGELMATVSFNARDEVTGEALASASYPSGLSVFTFIGGEVSVASDSLPIIGSADLTIPLPQKVDRFGLNKSALAAEPLPNEYVRPTGSFTGEFKGLTQFEHFVNTDAVKVTLLFEGATISESNKETLKIELPACHFTGTTPNISGPDVVEVPFPFEVYANGTEAPVIIEYVSADTTL